MALYSDTLSTMMGRVQQVKPNAKPEQCRQWLNDRIRELIDGRPYWSDMMRQQIISIPQPYNSGTVSATYQSNVIAGAGTGWVVSDVVNTTLSLGVSAIGNQWATPSSMVGITENTLLLIDAGTPSQEVVSVLQVAQARFVANFQFTHNGVQGNPVPSTAAVVTSSSLSNLQIRMASYQPIFTVMAVVDAQTLLMNLPWGGPSATALGYSILKMYCTMPSDFKDFLSIVDPVQGIPIAFHVSQRDLDFRDPQRTSSGEPCFLADRAPDSNGNMQYEIWPPGSAARQLSYLYCAQWPEMRKPTDRPPFFLNPTVLVDGACAKALRTRVERNDAWYDLPQSKMYEADFEKGMTNAVNADESKSVRNYTQFMDGALGMGQNSRWALSHDWDSVLGLF